MQEEIWKDINGYEKLYQVSNLGRVKSLKRDCKDKKGVIRAYIKEHICALTDNGFGYKIVSLCKNGKRKNAYIHRLVAEHFLNNQYNLREVNHIDLDKSNNNVTNLEWVTSSQNKEHFFNTEQGRNKAKKVGETRFNNLVNGKENEIIKLYTINKKAIQEISKIEKIGYSVVKKVLLNNNIKILGRAGRKRTILKYRIIMMNEDGNILKEFNDYSKIYDFIINKGLSKAKRSTIKHEIYDAITRRRKNNKKYGFYWEKRH